MRDNMDWVIRPADKLDCCKLVNFEASHALLLERLDDCLKLLW